jgi:hypothetical protein
MTLEEAKEIVFSRYPRVCEIWDDGETDTDNLRIGVILSGADVHEDTETCKIEAWTKAAQQVLKEKEKEKEEKMSSKVVVNCDNCGTEIVTSLVYFKSFFNAKGIFFGPPNTDEHSTDCNSQDICGIECAVNLLRNHLTPYCCEVTSPPEKDPVPSLTIEDLPF